MAATVEKPQEGERAVGCQPSEWMVAVTEQKDETGGEGGGVHQQNVKTSPGLPRGVMVPLVLLVHPDPLSQTVTKQGRLSHD